MKLADLADKQTEQKMIQEIHTMLMHLTKEVRGK